VILTAPDAPAVYRELQPLPELVWCAQWDVKVHSVNIQEFLFQRYNLLLPAPQRLPQHLATVALPHRGLTFVIGSSATITVEKDFHHRKICCSICGHIPTFRHLTVPPPHLQCPHIRHPHTKHRYIQLPHIRHPHTRVFRIRFGRTQHPRLARSQPRATILTAKVPLIQLCRPDTLARC